MSEFSRRRGRLARRLSWLVVAALATTALLPLPVSAADVAPNADDIQFVDGNPGCAGDPFFSFKVDGPDVQNGATANGVIILSNVTDVSFDWAIAPAFLDDYDIAAVIVKAGDGANVYFYEDTTDDSDTNLQSPDNDGGQQAAISHLEFCFDEKVPPEPTPTPVEPTPTPVEPTPTPVEPTPTPVEPTSTPTGEVSGMLNIQKVDNKGTLDNFLDDEPLDGASFEIWLDDGDAVFEDGEDDLVAGPSPAPLGQLDLADLPDGDYWIVEVVVPDGFIGTDPLLVELNVEPGTVCLWDYTGLLGCGETEGELAETVVFVDNAPEGAATATPTGGVEGATGRPRVTLPPTDTLPGRTANAPAGDGWRLVLLAMAGLLGAALLLTPSEARARRR